jgi:hypothetical protein
MTSGKGRLDLVAYAQSSGRAQVGRCRCYSRRRWFYIKCLSTTPLWQSSHNVVHHIALQKRRPASSISIATYWIIER